MTEASTCLDDEQFYLWYNTPNENGNQRNGIIYGDLSDVQLMIFKNLLQLFMSDGGYHKVGEITFLAEGLLNTRNSRAWSPDYYSIELFDDPENSSSRGFSLMDII